MSGVFTVSQITGYIKTLFQRDYVLTRVAVTGEISNCKYHPQGHIYFTLKDEGGALSCVCFQSQRANLSMRLMDGQMVEVRGQITVYEKSGSCELIVRDVKLSGEGILFERFQKLKEELAEMGMFDPMYKKPIPRFAQKIGIVTSDSGAAVRDICNVSKRRNPYVKLYLSPCLVQGDGAAPSIADAIRKMDEAGTDVIIVGRGGGSIEDLWAFNEEIVARAIFSCKTPVISAVGHETDFTIADFVADLRAPTPSAAAEIASFDYESFEAELKGYETLLSGDFERKLSFVKSNLQSMEARLSGHSPEATLGKMTERTKSIEKEMRMIIQSRLREAKSLETGTRELLKRDFDRKLWERKQELSALASRMDALSPLKKISGGFGFVETEKGAVRSIRDVSEGDSITVTMRDGRIRSTVTGVCENGE